MSNLSRLTNNNFFVFSCLITRNTKVFLRSSATPSQKIIYLAGRRVSLCQLFSKGKAWSLQQGCRLAKTNARKAGKGGEPNRSRFDSCHLIRRFLTFFKTLRAKKDISARNFFFLSIIKSNSPAYFAISPEKELLNL